MGLAGKIKNGSSDASAGAPGAGSAIYNGYDYPQRQQRQNGGQLPQIYGRFTPSAPPLNTTTSSNAAAPPPACNNGVQTYPAAAAAPPPNYAQPYNAGASGCPPISPPLQHNSQCGASSAVQPSQPYYAASAQHSYSYASSADHSQYASSQHSQPYVAPPSATNNYQQSLPYHQPPPPAASTPAPAPPHQQYYMHSSTPSHTMQDLLAQKLQSIVQVNGLQRFYDPARLQSVLHKVASINFADIAAQWSIGRELAYDLAPLALYDIVFYCDDSYSMAVEEKGERINDLKFILSKVSDIATLFDDDGITVRFMNSNANGDGVRNAVDVEHLISQLEFSGSTPLGTNFDYKVIQPFVLAKATATYNNASSMAKPVLAIIITDGEPNGEAEDTIVQVIRHAKVALSRSPYGSGALAVQIAQVGKDTHTQKFLESLDKDPIVGKMIDCTSYYEMEEQEFARKGVTLTPELWLLKMCVGAIDPEYDSKDD